jgi:hypothetical protein
VSAAASGGDTGVSDIGINPSTKNAAIAIIKIFFRIIDCPF